jgi:hypothetical protein
MNIKALSIDLNVSQDLMCAIVVRRLRELRWTPKEIESSAEKAIVRIERVIKNEDVLSELAKDAALMHAGGAGDKMVQQMANALFAVRAVTVADDMHKSRVAEFN